MLTAHSAAPYISTLERRGETPALSWRRCAAGRPRRSPHSTGRAAIILTFLGRFDFETFFHRALLVAAVLLLWPLLRALRLVAGDAWAREKSASCSRCDVGFILAAVPLLLRRNPDRANIYSLRHVFHSAPWAVNHLLAVRGTILEEPFFRGLLLGLLSRSGTRSAHPSHLRPLFHPSFSKGAGTHLPNNRHWTRALLPSQIRSRNLRAAPRSSPVSDTLRSAASWRTPAFRRARFGCRSVCTAAGFSPTAFLAKPHIGRCWRFPGWGKTCSLELRLFILALASWAFVSRLGRVISHSRAPQSISRSR